MYEGTVSTQPRSTDCTACPNLLMSPVHAGYYIVNILCVVFGIVTFWGFIRPKALQLQNLPLRAWRLSNGS